MNGKAQADMCNEYFANLEDGREVVDWIEYKKDVAATWLECYAHNYYAQQIQAALNGIEQQLELLDFEMYHPEKSHESCLETID